MSSATSLMPLPVGSLSCSFWICRLQGFAATNMDLHVGKLHTMGLDGNGAGQVECKTQRQHKGNEQQERNGLQEQRREHIFHQRSCASGLELSLETSGAPF